MTDPLWSGSVRLVHAGAELNRFDKVRALAHDDVARRHLRSCWENRDGAFNCCRCEKCLRTMASLRALGVLRNFATFDRDLELQAVATGRIAAPIYAAMWQEVLDGLREGGREDVALERAVEERLRRGPRRHRARAARARMRRLLRR